MERSHRAPCLLQDIRICKWNVQAERSLSPDNFALQRPYRVRTRD